MSDKFKSVPQFLPLGGEVSFAVTKNRVNTSKILATILD